MKEIVIPDIDRTKKILNEYGENAPRWPYREEKADLDKVATLFKRELIDPVLRIHRSQMPDPIIGFDDAGNQNILAYYNNKFDPHGLPDVIIYNTAQYVEEAGSVKFKYSRWTKYEILAHEMGHGLLNFLSKVENRQIPAHGKEFCNLLEGWGLHPVPGIGCHAQVADADKPFGRIMKELLVSRPGDVPRGDIKIKTDWFRPTKPKGISTLNKWECPECHIKARIGIKGDPEIIHDPCSQKKGEKVFFVRVDGKAHNIYKSK